MRLKHRIPVRVRHYWKFLAGCVAFLLVLTVTLSTVRIRPYVTSSAVGGDVVTQDIVGTVDLFDETAAHSITLVYRDADYQRMLDTFYAEGEKDYIEADLVIDGTSVPSVGIRLKGNSTLRSLSRNGETPQGAAGPNGARPGGDQDGGRRQRGGQDQPSGTGPAGPEGAPGDGVIPDGADLAPNGGGMSRISLQAEEPENLPWLIRFDEYVDGRRYQGHRELSLRVAGMGGGSTVLNEAVTLDLLGDAGEVAQEYAYTSFTVNDRPTTARLVVEHPDENFTAKIDGSGVLYKSLATGSFTDQGDDPTAYDDDFKQITMKGSQDLQPVIDLIRWVENASDTEFDEQLADRVDVESFARYVAWQNLLLNFDDMSGPGRNYYLWYDLTSKKFTVIGWDYNLTFSGDAGQGPHEQGRLGGGFRGGGATRPTTGQQGAETEGGAPPGFTAPDTAPPGFDPEVADARPDRAGRPDNGGPGGAGPGGGGHLLKERFLASETFTQVYEDAYRALYRQVYADGAALAALDGITEVLSSVDGQDAQTVTDDANRLRTLVGQRTESLAADPVITQS
ncbi:CotH kinase family protein [Micromonospora sp. NPDC049900]|uniref:CotH kinase family protein n=1 Tax=Micromonospora sp. NPDC049900 TaxID=3364275 RepID=UPI00379D4CC1